jgi:hypothetical protein
MVIRLSTEVTPGASHYTFGLVPLGPGSNGAMQDQMPAMCLDDDLASVYLRVSVNASSILCLTSKDLARDLTWIELVIPFTPLMRRTASSARSRS